MQSNGPYSYSVRTFYFNYNSHTPNPAQEGNCLVLTLMFQK